MAGKIKQMIDKIIEERSHGNTAIAGSIRAKLCLKGIIINKYTETSEDDPIIIAKIQEAAKELDVKL